jgi:hypothetical protein
MDATAGYHNLKLIENVVVMAQGLDTDFSPIPPGFDSRYTIIYFFILFKN